MAYDFRANQIRTNKIIASGSTGTSASIMLYGHENDGIPPLSGRIAETFDTGSIGSDTFFYISGSESKRSVFGGGLTFTILAVGAVGAPKANWSAQVVKKMKMSGVGVVIEDRA